MGTVTKVIISNPKTGFKHAPSHQARGAGSRSLPAPGLALKSKYPGAGTTPALAVAVRPILGTKSYTQALVGLAGQAKFSCSELSVQAHPPFILSPQEACQASLRMIKLEKPMTPAAKPVRTNDQPGKDGPPTSQETVPEDLNNDHEASNQPAEPEMSNLATQISAEECPDVRIDNLLPLKTWAQGQDLNPEPKFLQAAGPMN
ncbi:hypothetical protein DSO57_1028689 [Entomophthora muscae]|uniref:Uncharacterized protein n=1 Tax=Entomophthora muscae TaxID=34485 RepID=A0ACC2SE04_9FUNG|nr:hypothetical protein DSO57_1028689 [Entomophthora muscae]